MFSILQIYINGVSCREHFVIFFSFNIELRFDRRKMCALACESFSPREKYKPKVLNRSNVIVTEKYNTEEQILLESFRYSLG